MATCEHFVYETQGVIGTYVTPTRAIPVITAGATGSQREMIDLRVTGACRGLHSRVLGAKPVSGAIETQWWDKDIATLIKAFLTDTATTGASPYTHGFLPDDDADLGMLSGQLVYNSNLGVSLLAMVINSLEISVASKELAKLTFNYEARDKVRSGSGAGDWDSLGTSAPAVVSPAAMYEEVARPLAFYDGVISYGGTMTYDSSAKTISVSGDTPLGKVLSATITISNNVDTDGYAIVEDPTRQEFDPGSREIAVSLEISWSDKSYTLYDLAQTGVATVLQLALFKSASLGAGIVIPGLVFDPFALPQVAGDKGKRTISLTGKGTRVTCGTPSVDTDINMRIINEESSI
ncbi:MAG: hypothetical protein DRP09_17435 [Candidatus Thorarchaeota archaeon]|nr:MAG: hypothetical protein DRP09_17435 [Candidatus Thorarchaeota archaeon]